MKKSKRKQLNNQKEWNQQQIKIQEELLKKQREIDYANQLINDYEQSNYKNYILEFGFTDFLFFRDDKNFKNFIGNTQDTLLIPNKKSLIGSFKNFLIKQYFLINNINKNIDDFWIYLENNMNNDADFNKIINFWGENSFNQSTSAYGTFLMHDKKFLLPIPDSFEIINSQFSLKSSLSKSNNNLWFNFDINSINNCNSNIKTIDSNQLFYKESRFFTSIDKSTRCSIDGKLFECNILKTFDINNKFLLLLKIDKSNYELIDLIDKIIDPNHNLINLVHLGGENKLSSLIIYEFKSIINSIDLNKTDDLSSFNSISLIENCNPIIINDISNLNNNFTKYSKKSVNLGGWDSLSKQEIISSKFAQSGFSFVNPNFNNFNNINFSLNEININNNKTLTLIFK